MPYSFTNHRIRPIYRTSGPMSNDMIVLYVRNKLKFKNKGQQYKYWKKHWHKVFLFQNSQTELENVGVTADHGFYCGQSGPMRPQCMTSSMSLSQQNGSYGGLWSATLRPYAKSRRPKCQSVRSTVWRLTRDHEIETQDGSLRPRRRYTSADRNIKTESTPLKTKCIISFRRIVQIHQPL